MHPIDALGPPLAAVLAIALVLMAVAARWGRMRSDLRRSLRHRRAMRALARSRVRVLRTPAALPMIDDTPGRECDAVTATDDPYVL